MVSQGLGSGEHEQQENDYLGILLYSLERRRSNKNKNEIKEI